MSGPTRRAALACFGAGWLPLATQAQPGPMMLAQGYRPGDPVSIYAVSEKYDGLRGYWDGRALWTRGGEPVAAPAWFTAGWPAQALDGELWAGRGGFERAVGVARRKTPDEAGWRRMRFMIFDLPAHGGEFRQRYAALRTLVPPSPTGWAQPVAQSSIAEPAVLDRLLRETVRAGGEGLMLHRWNAYHRAGRSADLLKYKPHDDADARVVGHEPGRGQFAGVLGALLVETPQGQRFKLGTGLNVAQRRDPPPLGSWVSYRHRGHTDDGVPRFASFLRVRPDLPGS